MKNYLLLLNGVVINDFFTRRRAEIAFERRVENADWEDAIELYDVRCGKYIAAR